MSQRYRLPAGGLIERARKLHFSFAGMPCEGYAGDTLASALLANGHKLLARSFKYHRPRGLVAAGFEEPNALVQLGQGAHATPNLRATEIELYDGLVANPVNAWPSIRFDVGALNGLFARFLSAGFYYKTFMWPHWHLYEWAIRRAAGLGQAPKSPDPSRYDTQFAHCDVLVVGAGAAGLAAARVAAATGARVILAEQDFILGGRLMWDDAVVDGLAGREWVAQSERHLRAHEDARVLRRTAAVGYFDHNFVALVERVSDHLNPAQAPSHRPRQRLWQVRAKQVVLATGATERPLVFSDNDRPGVMLASAVRQYIRRYAVRPAERAVVFTNNDDAYATAQALQESGAVVAAVVDTRANPDASFADLLRRNGVELLTNAAVVGTAGAVTLRGVTVRGSDGPERRIACDLLAVSGGFNPNIQLLRQSGGKLAYDARDACFKPHRSVQAEQSVGAAAGDFDLNTALRQGHEAGERAATAAGFTGAPSQVPATSSASFDLRVEPCWTVAGTKGKAFVDFQNDVTADDIALAARENFVSVEHLKRYTTLGMATDQGKTSNVNALAIMAEVTGRPVADVGSTSDRFPVVPVALGALGGRARGTLFKPMRRLPIQAWHETHRAVFEEFGGWLRPAHYRRDGEDAHAAEQREARAVRERVGIFDGSPLGKIEVKGPDAATFLDRIYANPISTLKPGKVRYGLMLNELGVVIDDGVTARFADDHFLVGTTSGGAARIAAWLEEWLQGEWPDLDVVVAPMTPVWGVITISGPNARAVLAAAGADVPLSPRDFPHMSFRLGSIAGVPARIFRVSFTGELSYEVNVPARQTAAVWETLVRAGRPHGIEPVGIDAWMLLRTEKGYLHVGGDTDGTTSVADVGWGRVVKRNIDFVGKRSLLRTDNLREDRLNFVGLEALGPTDVLPVGAHLVLPGSRATGSEGYVSSSGFSPVLGRGVALGMVKRGRARQGEVLDVMTDGAAMKARIAPPCAYDPKGHRLNA